MSDFITNLRVDKLNTNGRIANVLECENIIYISQILEKSEVYFLCIPNFGRKSLKILKEALLEIGIIWPANNSNKYEMVDEKRAAKLAFGAWIKGQPFPTDISLWIGFRAGYEIAKLNR